ncbi:MAG: hypothetical protein HZC41_07255 [Chloroflexi bacterium]|nr:hypothetical protein [Chloroflexota bacterium]
MGHGATADEMIAPVLYLASDASRYTTGTTLYNEGGYMLNLLRYRP